MTTTLLRARFHCRTRRTGRKFGWDHPASGEAILRLLTIASPGGRTSPVLVSQEMRMLEVTVERRSAPRYPMVLAALVLELSRGAKLTARTSEISRTGCEIDTLNPSPVGSKVRLRLTHHDEIFEAVGSVVATSATSEWVLPSRKLLPVNSPG